MREHRARRVMPFAAACLLVAAFVTAQTTTSFTAPDGSRFVLVANPAIPLVHWAIATPEDDPARYQGLSVATMRASLGGTWTTGSIDADRERLALGALDEAFTQWFANPTDPARSNLVGARKQAAEQLADRAAFRRVLASLPVHRPEIVERAPYCLLVLTTTADALSEVARVVVERREQQALRDIQLHWTDVTLARYTQVAADPDNALRAEVLALAIPDHPYARRLERMPLALPSRDEALATWHATQRPERTVHVLLGDFDAAAARTELERAFATTALPTVPATPIPAPRPITSLRRSTVNGLRTPTLAIAFVLPNVVDPRVLDATARWLGDGPDAFLAIELQRLGRKDATVRCDAPWPPTPSGRSLFSIEISDANGIDQLADAMTSACRKAGATAPTQSAMQAVVAAMQRERTTAALDPRRLAADLAVSASTWPDRPVDAGSPGAIEAATVQQFVKALFATQPVIVEGRP